MPTYLTKKEKFDTLFLSIKPIIKEKKYMKNYKRLKKTLSPEDNSLYIEFKDMYKLGNKPISDNDLFWTIQYQRLKAFILNLLESNNIQFPIETSEGDFIKRATFSNPYYKLEYSEYDHYETLKFRSNNKITYANYKKINHYNSTSKESTLLKLPGKITFPMDVFVPELILLDIGLYELKLVSNNQTNQTPIRFEIAAFNSEYFLITSHTDVSNASFKALISATITHKNIKHYQLNYQSKSNPLSSYFNNLTVI